MPSQVKAAVKDTGVARKLLEKLKLRGVVQIGADQVAYIRVEKKTTRKVREGEKLLSFVVKKIESGKVVLSLEGVEVVLRH
jgi:Tfp pilus assembly protein PilP